MMGPPAPDATPSTVHTEAAALRMGLAMGLIGVQDVVAWADRLIVENGAAGVPEAFELCTLDARQDAEAITLLREVGDAGDASALGRAVCAWIADRLAADEITVTHAARLLKQLMREGFRAGPDFEDTAYYFDDAVDLAPTVGPSLDQLRLDLLDYLREMTS